MAREKVGSRVTTSNGKNSTHQRSYRVETQGATSAQAITAIMAASPTSVIADGVTLNQRVPSVQYIGNGYWTGTVSYRHEASRNAEAQNQNLDEVGKIEVTLDLGTESKHITEPIRRSGEAAQKWYETEDGPSAERKLKSIGVQDGNINGVDILSPSGNLQVTKVFDNATVFGANWVEDRANLRCTVNDDEFYGFEAHSLLFVRMSFTIRNNGDVPVTFQFQHRANVNEQTAVSVGAVNKKGHEYLWTQYETEKDTTGADTFITKTAIGQYVATVYKSADFGTLDIGGV